MIKLSQVNEVLFFEFIYDKRSVSNFEKNLYESASLENEIGTENYLKLLSFDYKSNNDQIDNLSSFIKSEIIQKYRYKAWCIQNILELFISDSKNINKNLLEIYDLYLGEINELEERRYNFNFLQHLALNYFHWLEEGYLRINDGDDWKAEYNKNVQYFDFYHMQLKPFAELILQALKSKEIEILEDGTYYITEDLKVKLESANIYKLEHPKDKLE